MTTRQHGAMPDAPTPADVVAAWNELAAFWDERSGPTGSELHRLLIAPSLHRLVGVTAGETILDEEQRDLSRLHSVKVSDYRDCVDEYRASGEPVPHWFFHRSMSTLVSAAADVGFVVDGLDEPMLSPEADTTSAWGPWRNIPPVLVVRLRQASRRESIR